MLDGKSESKSLMEFPCNFTLKVFGKATQRFETAVVKVIKKHFPEFRPENCTRRLSADKHYLALSIVVYAQSKEQLEAVYQALHGTKSVLIIL